MHSLEQYIDDTLSCLTEDRLFATFEKVVHSFGVEFWAYHILSERLHAVPFESGVVRQNYPPDFVQFYNDNRLADIDPVILLCRREAKPFHWTDVEARMPLTPAQTAFMEGIRQLPITDGLAFPLFGPMNSLAYFNLATTHPGGLDLSPAELRRLQCVCLQTHNRYLDIIGNDKKALKRPLSPREQEVMTLIASGLSNHQVASRLGITENTVDTLLRRVFAKLGVNNRITAVVKVIGNGLILPVPDA